MSGNPGTSAAGAPAGASASNASAAAAPASTAAPKAAAAEGNPVFRMMGLPDWKLRLPSRNWTIFLTITGSFAAAVFYDRREKKRVVRKWCDLVSPLADDFMPPNTMPRRVTIYLAAPPGDGLRSAREHFYEYIKPVLVAGAMDWDVVEGRREGDVRYGAAERIRRGRRRQEVGLDAIAEDEEDKKVLQEAAIRDIRERAGIADYAGVAGDIVVGRHTWKEYIRGVHEGWLGPLEKPKAVGLQDVDQAIPTQQEDLEPHDRHGSIDDAAATATPVTLNHLDSPTVVHSSPAEIITAADTSDQSPQALPSTPTPEEKKKEEEKAAKAKNTKPDPYITTAAYASTDLPRSLPEELTPATILPFPHILGFLNTPIRVYRFLNRRQVADDIGRHTAAAVLASYRSFDASATQPPSSNEMASSAQQGWEQQGLLAHEEPEWPKVVKKRRDALQEGEESVWLDGVVLDERIAGRMRVFEVTAGDEEAARALYEKPRGAAGAEKEA